jgi:hypothetical protein
MSAKEERIQDCMDLLEGVYLSTSAVYAVLKKGLTKMNKEEVGALYSMLLTRVVVAKLKGE